MWQKDSTNTALLEKCKKVIARKVLCHNAGVMEFGRHSGLSKIPCFLCGENPTVASFATSEFSTIIAQS